MQLRNKSSITKETPEKKSVEKQKAAAPASESASKSVSKKKTKANNEHSNIQALQDMANLLRVHCVEMTNKAGSGHPTSCGSCADFISVLFFDPAGMHYDPKDPANFANDRFVLSKGHAAPILYAAWARAGFLKFEDLDTLRAIDSKIEGHPTPDMPFVDVATGSLGQGLGAACGMAYSSKYFDKINNTYFCLMGDGEIGEGSVWEAANFAAQYKLDNLIAIVDCNKFGQSNVLGHPLDAYKNRFAEFGWFAQVVDGHDVGAIVEAFEKARNSKDKPSVIIGKTYKGHNYGEGIEDNMKFHGKPLGTDAPKALEHLKTLIKDPNVKLTPTLPSFQIDGPKVEVVALDTPAYELNKKVATREAYGHALKTLGKKYKCVIGLDADLKNSTFSEQLYKEVPTQFIECFISEQNMVSVATGVTARHKITFSSTFAAFFTRAYDQIRMGGISRSALNFCGSHAGCSIGEDGASQMALEDLAIFRAVPNSVVLYPTDAVSTERAVVLAANYTSGMSYIRTCRLATEVLYKGEEVFEIGKCKVLQKSDSDKICLVAAGVTVYECQKAAEKLKASNINVSIVDLFSIKPLDYAGVLAAAQASGNIIITAEDHYRQGGIFEAVSGAFSSTKDVKVFGICVEDVPKSGKSLELFDYCKIGAKNIEQKVLQVLKH